jgi:tetratricopeptide (TPR) repeat protein
VSFRFLLLVLALAATAGCSAYSKAISRGDELAREGQWEAAENAYLDADAKEPGKPETQLRIQNVRNKRAESWVARGRAARDALNFDESLKAYNEALKVTPDNPEISEAWEAAYTERLDFAEGDLKKGALESAESHAAAVLVYLPDLPRAVSLRGQIQIAFSKRAFATAEDFEKNGKLGNALIEYLKADQFKIGATAARERADAVRKKLRTELTWFVEAPSVTDKSNSPDIAQRLGAGRLGQSFGEKIPLSVVTQAPKDARGVRLTLSIDRVLFNREKTSIQRSKKYLAGMKSVPNPERAKNEQKLLEAERYQEEVDDAFSKSLRRYTDSQNAVDRARDAYDRCTSDALAACQKALDDCREDAALVASKAAAAATAAANAEKPQSPPPIPEACQKQVCDANRCAQPKESVSVAEREQGQRRIAVDNAGTSVDRQHREIQRLRDLVYRTPLTVEQPMYADFVYDIDIHTLNGRALVTLQMDDLQAEPMRQPFSQDFLVSKKDETHKGYDRYEILVDPLVLPNEMDVRIELGEKALVDVVKRVRAKFDVYRDGWLKTARLSLPRAAAEDATENLVRAVLVSADAPPQDILDALAKAKGLQKPLGIIAQQ